MFLVKNLKNILATPVYLVTAWFLAAGMWQTFEMYRWANNRVEQIEARFEKAENVANVLSFWGDGNGR